MRSILVERASRVALGAAALTALATVRSTAQSSAVVSDTQGVAVCAACVDRDAHRGWKWPALIGGVAAAAVADERLSAFARTHQTPALNRVAEAVDPLGRAGVLVPTLVASVIAPRILGQRGLSDAALRISLGYAAADGVESVLKPLIGRHRPSDAGNAWRFHPFRNDADWHSLPSAHSVHAFSLAAALAMEARTPWVRVPAYGAAALVAVERVYTGQHWSSDVVSSAILAVGVSQAVERSLRRRGIRHLLRPVADSGDATR
jgi:hypothetical protein